MKITVLFLTFNLMVVAGFSQCASSGNVYSFQYNGKTYEIIFEQKTWAEAAACAEERGGYLVEINSQAEQDTMFSRMTQALIPIHYTTVSDGGGVAYVWIGATDKDTEGTWLWDGDGDGSGTNFWNGEGAAGSGGGSAAGGAYYNWGGTGQGIPNEPDDYNNNQDAAGIALESWPKGVGSLGSYGEWNDISVSNQLYFIIEDSQISSGIEETAPVSLEVSPNPVSDRLNINLEHHPGLRYVEVYDLNGSLVFSGEVRPHTSTYTLNTSEWSPGVYLVVVSGEGKHEEILREKVVVE